MGFLKKVWKKVKKAVGADDNGPKTPRAEGSLGPSGGGSATSRSASDAARMRRQRGARGRDSTIIAGRSELGSRTLLG